MILKVVLANIVDAFLGDPYSFPHPVIYMGKLISYIEKRWRRINKKLKSKTFMIFGGIFIWIVLCSLSFFVTYFFTEIVFDMLSKNIDSIYLKKIVALLSTVVNVILIWTSISTRCLYNESMKVYKSLKSGDVLEARKFLSYIVGRQTDNLSEGEIIRATVETVAENTVDGTISPIFYSFVGGAKMAIMYKAVNTMDSMLGYKNERYIDIGKIPARMDDLFNFIPARLSVISFTLAAFFLKYDYKRAFIISIRDRKKHKSPNCAYSEGAVAGALGIELGGDNVYFGEIVKKPTIGDKKKNLDIEDIRKANMLMIVSSIFTVLIFSAVYGVFIIF